MEELLKKIIIGDKTLLIKNYHCIDCGENDQSETESEYIPKTDAKMRLYVHVTDKCNASCLFCRRKGETVNQTNVSIEHFKVVLHKCAPYISSVAITGGEPMLFPQLVNSIIEAASNELPKGTDIDLVTNGTNFILLPEMQYVNRLTAIHLSRHSWDDNENRKIMGFEAPSTGEIQASLNKLRHPEKVVLNCTLRKSGVNRDTNISCFLGHSIDLGIRNNSFITLFQANHYCKSEYVSPNSLTVLTENGCEKWNQAHPNNKFSIWNQHRDYDFCHCVSGSYENERGKTRFYFRCPGTQTRSNYCRQLVYTADNHLCDGYDGNRILC